MKYIVDMPEGWCFKNGATDDVVEALSHAEKAIELNAHSIGLYGYGNGNDCYDGEGNPVKLYAVEDK